LITVMYPKEMGRQTNRMWNEPTKWGKGNPFKVPWCSHEGRRRMNCLDNWVQLRQEGKSFFGEWRTRLIVRGSERAKKRIDLAREGTFYVSFIKKKSLIITKRKGKLRMEGIYSPGKQDRVWPKRGGTKSVRYHNHPNPTKKKKTALTLGRKKGNKLKAACCFLAG